MEHKVLLDTQDLRAARDQLELLDILVKLDCQESLYVCSISKLNGWSFGQEDKFFNRHPAFLSALF